MDGTAAVTVTSPNGGETLTGGGSHTVKWYSKFLSSDYVVISYSTNNGSSWTSITTSTANDGEYVWTLPGTSSSLCLVKITEYNNSSVYDISDAVFTINAITVTAPNGGETLYTGTSKTITWTAGTLSSSNTVNLYYSTDNGTAWTSIATSETNDGSYTWTVPDVVSSSCLVKVEDVGSTSVYDVSNAVFSIAQSIVVTSPNGGESLPGCATHTVKWTATQNTNATVYLYYSTDGGTSWTYIASATASTGTYSWTVPNVTSSSCLVKVTVYGNTLQTDVSNAVFSITSSTNIVVTSPNGAESWTTNVNNQTGGSYNHASGSLTVNSGYYYDDGGSSSYPSSNDYTLTIYPSVPGSMVQLSFEEWLIYPSSSNKMYIYDGTSTSASVLATYSYNSTAGTVTATNSSGALTVYYYSYSSTSSSTYTGWKAKIKLIDLTATQTIAWTSSGTSAYFDLDYSTDGGTVWKSIADAYYTASNTYTWNVPDDASSSCKVRVTDNSNSCMTDASDAVFTIMDGTAAVTVTSPNGGETWYEGTSNTIKWYSKFLTSDYVLISYSTDNGSTWTSITSSTINDGEYAWTTPSGVTSTQALIKILEYGNSSAYDYSDAVFTLSPGIHVITPNGDDGTEEWGGCTETSVVWAAGGTSNYYKIEYSTNNGSTWNSIETSYYSADDTTTYNWNIPNIPGTCLVKVSDKNDAQKYDISDSAFSISAPVIITYPNGGETLVAGSTVSILWTSDGASNFRKLHMVSSHYIIYTVPCQSYG
jgi:hypothetical protein